MRQRMERSYSPRRTRLALSTSRIGLINPDGTELVYLTSGAYEDYAPALSRDGKLIIFLRDLYRPGGLCESNAWIMNSNGTNLHPITAFPATSGCRLISATLSPDGDRAALSHYDSSDQLQIFTVETDGSDLQQLTFGSSGGYPPSWSPDGTQIEYQANGMLSIINSDGSGQHQVDLGSTPVGSPSWSWDNSILFMLDGNPEHIMSVSPDGSGLRQITSDADGCGSIRSWPSQSPGGHRLVYNCTASTSPETLGLRTINTDGTGAAPLLGASDRLFYVQSGQSWGPYVDRTLIDDAPPTSACGAVPTEWQGQNVTVSCSASDAGSGLANATDASFELATSVPAGVETSSALTDSRIVCDVANNCATAGPLGPARIDRKAPSVQCFHAPSFLLNSGTATVSATVTDAGSGSASPTVTTNADTSSPGSHSVPLVGTDKVGNSTTRSCSYEVVYNFSGFLQPVDNPTIVNGGKAGKKYPVKWRLSDAGGVNVSSLSSFRALELKPTSCDAFAVEPIDALEIDTTAGAGLRYDTSTSQFIYNWATPSVPGCYTLFLTLADGTSHPAFFNLR